MEKCYNIPSDLSLLQDIWICHPCDKSLKKKKIPSKANANNLNLNPKYDELEVLNDLELMLCCQCIPFMFIVGKQKGSQHGLKGQCVLVPADITKIQFCQEDVMKITLYR